MSQSFDLDKNLYGKIRVEFLKRVNKKIGKNLDLKSVYGPITPDSEKKEEKKILFKKINVKSRISEFNDRTLMFNASVKDDQISNLNGFLAPVPTTTDYVLFEEYSYSTILPIQIKNPIIFLETATKWKMTKRFITIDVDMFSSDLSKNNILDNITESSPAFKTCSSLQRWRNETSLGEKIEDIANSELTSPVSEKLNSSRMLKMAVGQMPSLTEAKSGNVEIREKAAIPAVFYPLGDSTLVQLGDMELNPKHSFNVLKWFHKDIKKIKS